MRLERRKLAVDRLNLGYVPRLADVQSTEGLAESATLAISLAGWVVEMASGVLTYTNTT